MSTDSLLQDLNHCGELLICFISSFGDFPPGYKVLNVFDIST